MDKTAAAFTGVDSVPEDFVLSAVRHMQYFDPQVFADTQVDVIGCGSVGSYSARGLAKAGVRNLHLRDFDIVEAHNIANQEFWPRHLGWRKVDALKEILKITTGLDATAHHEKVEGPVALGRVVVLAVDSMAARKNIFKQCLHLKPTTDVMIEVRMGAEEFRSYLVNPRSRTEVKTWLDASDYDDTTTVENICQARVTLPWTVEATASIGVVRRFIHWYRRDIVQDPDYNSLPVEEVLMLRPLYASTRGAE